MKQIEEVANSVRRSADNMIDWAIHKAMENICPRNFADPELVKHRITILYPIHHPKGVLETTIVCIDGEPFYEVVVAHDGDNIKVSLEVVM